MTSAPAFVFRYHTADRSETWTLQHAEGNALLVVDSAKGAQRYVGSATGDPTLVLDVSTGTGKRYCVDGDCALWRAVVDALREFPEQLPVQHVARRRRLERQVIRQKLVENTAERPDIRAGVDALRGANLLR